MGLLLYVLTIFMFLILMFTVLTFHTGEGLFLGFFFLFRVLTVFTILVGVFKFG